MKAEEAINTHKQRELDLRISTLEACEPATISILRYNASYIKHLNSCRNKAATFSY